MGYVHGVYPICGGKVEPGETPEAALAREIREELDTGIEVGEYLGNVYVKSHAWERLRIRIHRSYPEFCYLTR